MKKANVSNEIIKEYFSCHISYQMYRHIRLKKKKLKLRYVKSHRQLNSSPSPLSHPQDLFSNGTKSLSPILTNFMFGSLEIQ